MFLGAIVSSFLVRNTQFQNWEEITKTNALGASVLARAI